MRIDEVITEGRFADRLKRAGAAGALALAAHSAHAVPSQRDQILAAMRDGRLPMVQVNQIMMAPEWIKTDDEGRVISVRINNQTYPIQPKSVDTVDKN